MLDAQGLRPLLDFAAGLDLADPDAAREALTAEFPVDGDFVTALRREAEQRIAAGTLCHKGDEHIAFSRVARPGEETHGFSVDAVRMRVPGPKHRHPLGEIDLCLALEGEPRFDGHPEGWVVYGPGSVHVPTVEGGTMFVLYLLPEGSFELIESVEPSQA